METGWNTRKQKGTGGNMPRGYPSTPLVMPMRFKRATLDTLIAFKRARPWRGTVAERKVKFKELFDNFNEIYINRLNGEAPVRLKFRNNNDARMSGSSNYNRRTHTITLNGRLSVITALHEFRHAMGGDEFDAVKWSVNLYRITFPRLFETMENRGHVIVAPRSRS